MSHQLQRNRFELKYLVDENLAREIRLFSQTHLVADEYARKAVDRAYDIYSIYLDNPRYDLFNATIEGHCDRFKLRVRYYKEAPDAVTFFEIKRRVNDTILKERAIVSRDAARRLVEGGTPRRADLHKPDDRDWRTLVKFCELRDQMNASSRVIVAYRREAWVSPDDNSIRLTFDRSIRGAPFDGSSSIWRTRNWKSAMIPLIVLELKFTDRFPNWMKELVQRFDLYRVPLAKYVNCVEQLSDWRATGGAFDRIGHVDKIAGRMGSVLTESKVQPAKLISPVHVATSAVKPALQVAP